jgi:hypothetical protein
MSNLAAEITAAIKDSKMKKRAKILRSLPKAHLETMVDPATRPWTAEKGELVQRIISQWDENAEEDVIEYVRNMIG